MAELSGTLASLSKDHQFAYLSELKQAVINDFNAAGAAFRAGKMSPAAFSAAKAQMIARTKQVHVGLEAVRPKTATPEEADAVAEASRLAVLDQRFKPAASEAD